MDYWLGASRFLSRDAEGMGLLMQVSEVVDIYLSCLDSARGVALGV